MAGGDCIISSATCSKCEPDEHCGSEGEGIGRMGKTSSAMNRRAALQDQLLCCPSDMKQKIKRELQERKRLVKECKKTGKKMLKEFKKTEKEEKMKYKRRLKQFKQFVKEKRREDKKCQATIRKREKIKEKMRKGQQKERYKCLKVQMKMHCVMLGNRNIPLSECDCGSSFFVKEPVSKGVSECTFVDNLTLNKNPKEMCSKRMRMTQPSMGHAADGKQNKSRSKRKRSQSKKLNAKKCQKKNPFNVITGDCVEAHRRVAQARLTK